MNISVLHNYKTWQFIEALATGGWLVMVVFYFSYVAVFFLLFKHLMLSSSLFSSNYFKNVYSYYVVFYYEFDLIVSACGPKLFRSV